MSFLNSASISPRHIVFGVCLESYNYMKFQRESCSSHVIACQVKTSPSVLTCLVLFDLFSGNCKLKKPDRFFAQSTYGWLRWEILTLIPGIKYHLDRFMKTNNLHIHSIYRKTPSLFQALGSWGRAKTSKKK